MHWLHQDFSVVHYLEIKTKADFCVKTSLLAQEPLTREMAVGSSLVHASLRHVSEPVTQQKYGVVRYKVPLATKSTVIFGNGSRSQFYGE